MFGFKPSTRFLGLALLIVLVMVGLGVFFSQPPARVIASAPQTSGSQQDKPDNSTCLACHQKPGQTVNLPGGDVLTVTVDLDSFNHSAHASANVKCVDCHTEISGFPHPKLEGVNTAQDYKVKMQDTCVKCHAQQSQQLADSVHAKAKQAGNPIAPTCLDCHNPHTQPKLSIQNGKMTDLNERAAVPATCAKCHSAIATEYEDSVHGKDVMSKANTDTPTCTDCHGVHQISDPTTAQFRVQSPQMCGNCHTNAEIMNKYGISTAVYSTYVSDFHGTTVTLFDKTSPEHTTNKPVCYDCHGVHNIASVNDPQKGLAIETNMLATCQRCHPDASTKFPASWMSHYIPDPKKTPIVYYVLLFYNNFVPGVLGVMAIFVIADVFGKFRHRGEHSAQSKGEEKK